MSREFNLERAMAGEPVCTRLGHKARIIAFDRKASKYKLVALVEYRHGIENVMTYCPDGRWLYGVTDVDDLIMEEVKDD